MFVGCCLCCVVCCLLFGACSSWFAVVFVFRCSRFVGVCVLLVDCWLLFVVV